MQNSTALFTRLERQVALLYQKYQAKMTQTVYARFDPALFTEDFAPCRFYFEQIRHTLDTLAQCDRPAEIQFFSEKLLAQCTALHEAMQYGNPNQSSAGTAENRHRQLIERLNQLPPRERLAQYYEFLQALNEKLNQQKDQLKLAQSEQDKQYYQTQIEHTRQRRSRCLNAIEQLEEYLTFKEQLES
ncbi:primosomal replication protein [Pasteurellaceae bacterium LIM206]|nr:primosomal replication protein [Pasteurellaceae bacterium LIM206]